MTRMFAGVLPSEEAIEHLDEFLSVRREAADFRWSLPAQFHVTLAFLEDVPDRCFDDLVERLETAGEPAYRLHDADRRRRRLPQPGAGPDPLRRPRPGLLTPRRSSAGWPRARGPRPPRPASWSTGSGSARTSPSPGLPRPTEVSNWVRLLDTYEGPTWPVDRITLVASYLGEGPGNRPRYETVAELPFRGSP